jgi:predicted Zn-dependent protease
MVRDSVMQARLHAARDSSEAALLLREGQLDFDAGRDSAAASEFARALRLSPRRTPALAGLAMVEARADHPAEALALADSAVALGDTSVVLTSLRGRMLARLRRCPETVVVLGPFLRAHPEWTSPVPELVRCYLAVGRASDAVPVAQEAVRREPRAPPLQYALVDALTAASQFDSALAHARYLTELHPENGLWWALMARELVFVNRMEEARAAYERAFRLRPGLADSMPPIDRNAWKAIQSLPRRPPH